MVRMLTKLRGRAISCVCLVVLLLLSAGTPLHGQRTEDGPPRWFDSFYSNVRKLVRRYYPQATSHLLANNIHFEYDTRVFVVHKPLKNGRWQDTWEQRGPKKGGILGEIEFRRGRYVLCVAARKAMPAGRRGLDGPAWAVAPDQPPDLRQAAPADLGPLAPRDALFFFPSRRYSCVCTVRSTRP